MWWPFRRRKKATVIVAPADEPVVPHLLLPRKTVMDAATIRCRLESLGWRVEQRSIRRAHPDPGQRLITSWKVFAEKGGKTYELAKPTLDEAMIALGQELGVAARPAAPVPAPKPESVIPRLLHDKKPRRYDD